ncbi:MAG: GntR family transcriptional regulator [Clostridia bacterium]|nr:GntR family transcriptional regulator [Clostridia bacterium]
MAWSFDKHTPVYIQIAERIRGGIISGEYPPESQIPSVRQLAFMAAVNPNTVQRALTELEDEGIIYSKGTSGRFVTDDAGLIDAARHKVAKSIVSDFVEQAKCLGITKEEIIRMVEEVKE